MTDTKTPIYIDTWDSPDEINQTDTVVVQNGPDDTLAHLAIETEDGEAYCYVKRADLIRALFD